MVRLLLAISGPIGAWLVAHGISAENLTTVVEAIIVIVGLIPTIGALVWGVHAHTDNSKLEAVEAMPDVKQIVSISRPDTDSAILAASRDVKRPKVVK